MNQFTQILGFPFLASKHGEDVDKFIIYVHFLMVALFVGWFAYFLYTLFRFHQSRNPRADHAGTRSHASSYLELAVAGIEAVLLIGFAVPLWARVADEFPKESEATVVRVIAEQFAWNTRYPGPDAKFGKQDFRFVSSTNAFGLDYSDAATKDDFAANLNDFVVPVNKPVIVHLTSKDVIHSFKVNAFRVTQDAIPGLQIPLHFIPTKEGTFLINCAQLCGNAHAFMKGYVRVLSQAKYDEWVAEQVKKAAAAGAGPQSFE